MSIGLVLMHAALAATAFLVVLNGYLRGAAKAKIDGLLSLVWWKVCFAGATKPIGD